MLSLIVLILSLYWYLQFLFSPYIANKYFEQIYIYILNANSNIQVDTNIQPDLFQYQLF